MTVAASASADCDAGEEVFMSCTFEARTETLRVCFTEANVTYRFGPPGAPADLELTVPVADVDYVPWLGVGRSIWETVRFTNNAYAYEVYAGFDRMFGDETDADLPAPFFGGVRVFRDESLVQDLACRAETVDFAWGEGLYDAKAAFGLRWDPETRPMAGGGELAPPTVAQATHDLVA